MFGLLMNTEVSNAERVLHSSEKPFLAIIRGTKVSDKIFNIEKLLDKATDIIIGSGIEYTFFKVMGGKIGSFQCEDYRLDKLQRQNDVIGLKARRSKNFPKYKPKKI